MSKRPIQLVACIVILGMFFWSEYTILKTDASYFPLPLTLSILTSAVRYFVLSLVFGTILNIAMAPTEIKSPILVLLVSVIGVMYASLIYSVMRHNLVLIVTPTISLIPGTLIGGDMVTLFREKRKIQNPSSELKHSF